MLRKILPVLLCVSLLLGLCSCSPEIKETNELNFYLPRSIAEDFQPAFDAYRKAYPNVTLNVEIHSSEGGDYWTKTSAMVMAGEGPDIFEVDQYSFGDFQKIMANGSFFPLDELMASDPDFPMEQLNEGVLTAGQYNGKQYLVPLKFYAPVLLSTEEILEKTGFPLRESKDYFSFMQACSDYLEANHDNPDRPILMVANTAFDDFIRLMGVEWIDYKNKTVVDLNDPDLKRAVELNRNIFLYSGLESKMADPRTLSSDYVGTLARQESVFLPWENGTLEALAIAAALVPNQTPVFSSIPTKDGGVYATASQAVGIRNNSRNRLNAYNFIKLLLTDEVQKEITNMGIALPVNKMALREKVCQFMDSDFVQRYADQYMVMLSHSAEVTALSQETCDQFIEAVEDVEFCKYSNDSDATAFIGRITPYYCGEMTYEECVKGIKERYDFILTE